MKEVRVGDEVYGDLSECGFGAFAEYVCARERDVVQEERRMRTESSPIGRMFEQFLSVAYLAHPYGMPTVGYMSDLQRFTREDARAFYAKYYVPANITVVIVGDVGLMFFLRKQGKLYRGEHLSEPAVSHRRIRRLRAESVDGRSVLLEVDGEQLGALPATIEIVPGAIRIHA